MNRLVVFVILIASLTISCAHVRRVSSDHIPAAFRARDIEAAATTSFNENAAPAARRHGPPKVIRFHILAWQRTDTLNRHVDPFDYSDSCIAWAEFQHPDGTRQWGLFHLSRDRRGWREYMVFDAPYSGFRSFDHRPTKRDVVQFLKDTWWAPGGIGSDPIVEAGICKYAWLAAVGAPPRIILSYIERPKGRVFYY